MSVISNYPLQQFFVRYLKVSAYFVENIYDIKEKSCHYDVSTIYACDGKGHISFLSIYGDGMGDADIQTWTGVAHSKLMVCFHSRTQVSGQGQV